MRGLDIDMSYNKETGIYSCSPVSYTHLDVYKRQGGHPAFMCPVAEQGKQSDYCLKLDTDKAITYGLICDGGLLDKDDNCLLYTSHRA